MLQLDNEVKGKLENCKDVFPGIGIDCIAAFAGVNCRIGKTWEIIDRLPGDYEHNIILGAGNSLYQASFGIGFKFDEDMKIIQADSFDELCDAWGELANTYCGMLMDMNAFTSQFDVLTQSNPQYSAGQVFFPRAWTYCGSLVTETNKEIFLGFAIRKLVL